MLKENAHNETISAKLLVANPIAHNANANAIKPNNIGMRLSYFDTSQPDIGSPISELVGMNKRIVPSSASLYPKKVFIVGILDAQDEKQNPEIKKKRLKNRRCLTFASMLLQIRLQK
jgi:hypothetical protein